ncbi:MAG: type I 3-dehydroquinate dehydratase, partial [Tissierellia bacterium]|nr:type I 3-dehydroquinate dehydratase [Tissierellia bacterium]
FFKTPEKDEIVSRLRKMQNMGADIPKIAVMPQSTEDVLTLLAATNEMHTKYADRPIITMSMGPLGVISRLSGELLGSSMTFGALGALSAPGQIPVDELITTLEILHKAL